MPTGELDSQCDENPYQPHRRRPLLTSTLSSLLAKRRGGRKIPAVIWLQQNSDITTATMLMTFHALPPVTLMGDGAITLTLQVEKRKLSKGNHVLQVMPLVLGRVRTAPRSVGL